MKRIKKTNMYTNISIIANTKSVKIELATIVLILEEPGSP